MHHQEQDDRGHAQEMYEACGLEVVEQRSEFRELHRLPQRQAGHHDENADQDDTDVEQTLDRVVLRRIIVSEAQPQRVIDRRQQVA